MVPEFSIAFLPTLLDLMPSGVVCYTPQYDAAGTVVDFRFTYLNPSAQRILRLPAQPTASYAEQFPVSRTNGALAFYVDTYVSNTPGHFELKYQADGHDNYLLVDAQRVDDALLVTFTDSATLPRTPVEVALREDQAREQQARTAAQAALQQAQEQHELLAHTLGQVPAAVASLSGPEHRFAYINDQYRELTAGRAAVGRTVAELLPEVVGQGFIGLLDGVYTTGQPYVGKETPVQLHDATGRPVQRYLDFLYQPLIGEQGQITGLLVFAVDVTEKVQARFQVQDLNEELAAINEELRASNEEYLLANTDLAESQRELHLLNQALQALNQELRARMATEAALRQAQEQQELLTRTLGQVPAAVATFTGPMHRHSYFNERYQALASGRAAFGRTMAEVYPELVEQGFIGVLDRVSATGQPFVGREAAVQLLDAATGKPVLRYLDFIYQPLSNDQGQPQDILAFVVDVTEQVRARQQVEEQERQANLLNEELQAANEEIRANNHELTRTQHALRRLNSELEARVQERTREVEAAQQATEHQRALLQRVLEQAPVAIAILTEPSHRIAFANARMAAIWGRPVTQVLDQPHFEALPDTAGQGLEAVLTNVFKTGQPAAMSEQLTYLDRTGTGQPTAHYLHMVFEPLRDETGSVTGIITSALDVTELVVARQQVEDKERETNDLNGELQVANEEIRANNDELGRTQAALRELNEVLEARVAERTHQVETALQEAQQQREQLRVQQGLLSQILRQAPATIATLHGPEHHFTFFNEQYQRLAAGRAQLASTIAELFPEAVEEGLVGLLDRVYASGEPFTVLEGAVRIPDPVSGEAKLCYADFTYQPLFDAQGRVEGILAFSIDASARVLARQQVLQLNKELAVANAELQATIRQLTRTNADLDNFIYTASHDLKAPISNIEGLLNLLRELLPAAVRAEDEVAPVLGLMQGAIERFTRTIGHLTEVSKLQVEFAQPAAAVSLAAVVDDVRQDLLPLLTEAGAELEVDVDNCRPRVFSEKNLRSIVYNLLSNAVKYRAPGRVPRVRMACNIEGSNLVLKVQDNGLGLDVQQQSRLFQLFQRLHTHVEGTGLGLYMVKGIVENAGGTLTVQSQINVGTTFTLTFPA